MQFENMHYYSTIFGGFQALMPAFGWLAGDQLAVIVSFWAPWIAFLLPINCGK